VAVGLVEGGIAVLVASPPHESINPSQVLTLFIKGKGTPGEAIARLSEGFVGYGAMASLACGWLRLLDSEEAPGESAAGDAGGSAVAGAGASTSGAPPRARCHGGLASHTE